MTLVPAVRRQSGVTLIELLIGMLVSLIVLAAITTLFVNGLHSRAEINRVNTLLENGRYVTDLLVGDLHLAGYYAEFDLTLAEPTLDFPADLPDPCATALADLDLALPFHVQGYDSLAAAPLECINDWRKETDVIVLRRLSTCVAGTAGCDVVDDAPYFQASRCSDALNLLSPDSDDWFVLHTDPAELTKTERDCATVAGRRRFRTHIYFIANNDQSGDGIPTLKRMQLTAGGFEEEALANGVEDMQFEYGIDTDGDGAPDAYSANPTVFAGCADNICRMQNWRNVTAVKVNILTRSTTESRGVSASKSFTLGDDIDGELITVGPFDDGYKRHAFNSVAMLRNIAGRRR